MSGPAFHKRMLKKGRRDVSMANWYLQRGVGVGYVCGGGPSFFFSFFLVYVFVCLFFFFFLLCFLWGCFLQCINNINLIINV